MLIGVYNSRFANIVFKFLKTEKFDACLGLDPSVFHK